MGLLCTDVVHDYIRSELRPLDQVPADHAEAVYSALEAQAAEELTAEGLDAARAVNEREMDLRYTGQGYELRVPLSGLGAGGFDAADMAAARERFDEHHARIHGHAAKERAVELVSYRLRVRLAVPRYEPAAADDVAAADAPSEAVKGTRVVYFDADAGTATTIYERDRLPVGARLAGPAIVEQFDSTTVVPAGWTAQVDGYRNLILSREA